MDRPTNLVVTAGLLTDAGIGRTRGCSPMVDGPGRRRGHERASERRPAECLVEQTEQLDVLVIGSRGYGPLRAVIAGGVSGRAVRDAHCPVLVVPRGIEAPFGTLFGDATATAA